MTFDAVMQREEIFKTKEQKEKLEEISLEESN